MTAISTSAPARPAVFGAGEIVYPDSDGQPMAENTLQYEWVVTIKGGLEAVFQDRPDVFVAGDLLWYPVEGDPKTRTAPDAMVALGRPKGYRGSYKQWKEGGVAPQVVFEVLSPGNRFGEMLRKFQFYERFGVFEYYLYDPETGDLDGWRRQSPAEPFAAIEPMDGWVSPLLGVRFDREGAELRLTGPDGRPFASYLDLVRQRDEAERQVADAERRLDDAERRLDDAERRRVEAERRAEALAARLRELGADPGA